MLFRMLPVILLLASHLAFGQTGDATQGGVDSDHDGLGDRLESVLIAQFQPHFSISRRDCSVRPAQFAPFEAIPTPTLDDGTIYAQAKPARQGGVEIHYYHLWRRDCGEMGHALDAEHVAVLVELDKSEVQPVWKARYWYAAAHEDTVCDASQIARAKTLHAETQGANIWVSAGKHAAFLNETLCRRGCGGDRCEDMETLKIPQALNVGEPGAPMNGAIWVQSTQWPLMDKMTRSDFPSVRTARVDAMPDTSVVWANPSKRPMQTAILGGNAGLSGAATGARAAGSSVSTAGNDASVALDTATDKTGNAVSKSYRNVVKALGKATRATGHALGGGAPAGHKP